MSLFYLLKLIEKLHCQEKKRKQEMAHPRWNFILCHLDLKKQGDLRNSLVLLGVTQLWHVAQWVSRAPPHYTLPAFQNLNGSIFYICIQDKSEEDTFYAFG